MNFNRRDFIKLAGVVGGIFLTGCSSTEPENTTQSLESDENNEVAIVEDAPQSDYIVTIDGAYRTIDYEGKPALAVNYTFVNNSDEATSFLVAISTKVFQDGLQCDTAFVADIDESNNMLEVQPGYSINTIGVYELRSESDVSVEASEWFSFDDSVLASQTFVLAEI